MKTKDDEIILLMQNESMQERGMRMMMEVYQSRLYWLIRRLISDEEIAKDILQETLLRRIRIFFSLKEIVSYILGCIG